MEFVRHFDDINKKNKKKINQKLNAYFYSVALAMVKCKLLTKSLILNKVQMK